MKYWRENGKEFLQNGIARLRVTTMDKRPSPTSPGRILRFLAVNEILVASETNPIRTGAVLAMSFPSEKVNAPKFTWKAGEEKQVPIKFKLYRGGQKQKLYLPEN